MHLSQKQQTFSQILISILKFTLNFEHFFIKDDPYRICISEITGSEKGG